jgi:diguanylate cyclase (GGDEF)-like protein/PAS domain S-box-containing protein
MHRRLRRQLDEALGEESEPSPKLKKLFRRIEKEYRRADEDRASLQHALALLSDLLRRQPEAGKRQAISPRVRSVSRLFDQAPFAALLCDADRKVTAWNAAAERLFGIPHAEAVGRELSMLVFPDSDATRAQVRTELRQALAHGDTQQLVRPTPSRAGATRICEWTVVPLRDPKGREVGNAALVHERDPLPDRYALAWQGAGDGIWDWDLLAQRLWVSESWRTIVGATVERETPAEWMERIHPEDQEAVQEAMRAHLDSRSPRFESEHRLRHQDGSWRWVLARGLATRDAEGAAVRFAGSMMDVSEPKLTAVRVLDDALTRLPNRTHFLELARRSFARARRREKSRLAVVMIDVDGFRALNATLGRGAGDAVLLQLAERLQTCLSEGDVLARSGGDEFAVLLEDVEDVAQTENLARRIEEAAAHPWEVEGEQVSLTVSAGIALSAPVYTSAEELLDDADAALHRARAQGKGRTVIFDAALRERTPHLLALEAEMRQGLAREEFRVHYLPIVDVAQGTIQGLEALIRWAHPTRGLISPEHFMPFAEETGLIVPIGRWLLAEASREFQSCRQGLHGLAPRDLVLELTENTLQHGEHAPRIAELRDRGVRLFMDDFGTGSCSLNSLLRLQLDSLKIDRSLFSGGSPRGQAPELVRTIVSLARDMGTQVVAEGVETEAQFGFVRELGVSAAQGFYFSPPLDGDGVRSLLDRRVSWA